MSGNTEKLEDVKMEEVLEYQKIFKIENGFYQKLQALYWSCVRSLVLLFGFLTTPAGTMEFFQG